MSYATKPAGLPRIVQHPQRASVPALIILAYAAAVYLFFLAVLGYAAAFFAGRGVPRSIDQGPRAAVPIVATGLAACAARYVQPSAIHRARPVRAHPASPDDRVLGRLVVGACDDGRAHAVPGPRARADPPALATASSAGVLAKQGNDRKQAR